MTENEKKLAAEVWYDWCNNIYHTRPKNHIIDSSAGEKIFNRYFNFMRNKFDCLLIFKYGLKPEDVEQNIPNIRINPNDWKPTSTFWNDIIIFISYDLTNEEIEFAMRLAQPEYMKVDEKENLNAYAEFRRVFDKLKKLHPLEENKMTEKQYVADFTTLCVERVADNAAFVPSKILYDCFKRYMAAHHPSVEPISDKLFQQLFESQDGMKNLLCMKCFLTLSLNINGWGFKNLALTPAAQKLLEETK